MRRLAFALAALALVLGSAGPAVSGGGSDDSQIFFRDPDSETAARISKLVGRMSTDSVQLRRDWRRELAGIGWWSVAPLIEVAQGTSSAPGARCVAMLVLDAIGDRRAVEPLRDVVVKESTQQYTGGFAALALGRFRDPAAVEPFRAAVSTPKSMMMLKAAVPLALARIHTNEARDLLLERVHSSTAKEQPVRNAALLALGFFPESALDASGMRPGPDLAAGLANRQRRGERQSALLAFLVATAARTDTKPFLAEMVATEGAPEVAMTALLGLSHSSDADVTDLLAKTAGKQGDDQFRIRAADLLLDRADASVKPTLLQIVRAPSSTRLRAACVLALGRIDDDEVRHAVTEKLTDRSPLVRAAAAVSLTRRIAPAARDAALAAVEARLKHGETNEDVRADLEKARSVLAGERADVRWTEIGPDVLFGEMGLTYEHRLLREVNRRAEACLDLEKIHNLQTDTEIVATGPPSNPGDTSNDPGSEPTGGEIDPGAGDPGTPTQPTDNPSGQPTGDGPAPGAPRTSQWQELRDLKVDLDYRPYFGPSDLPQPTTTPAGPLPGK
jgi:HEAT repeat protein